MHNLITYSHQEEKMPMLTANDGKRAQERMELLDTVGQACDRIRIRGEAGMGITHSGLA